MSKQRQSFIAGVIMAMSVLMLFQDIVGLESYIEYCSRVWVTWYISTPIAILGLLFATKTIIDNVKLEKAKLNEC